MQRCEDVMVMYTLKKKIAVTNIIAALLEGGVYICCAK